MQHIVRANELDWEEKYFPGEEASYGQFKGLWKAHGMQQFEVRITKILPDGTNTKYHTHTKEEEWFYVLRGSCHICIDGEWKQIDEGDSVFKPIGMYHIFRNFGKEPCELIMLGSNVPGSEAVKQPEPPFPSSVAD